MKRVTILTLNNAKEVCDKLYEIYQIHIPPEFTKFVYKSNSTLRLPFLSESLELAKAIQYAQNNGATPRLYLETYYTPKELTSHPYFELFLPWPLELEGTSAENYGTQYQGGCPYCGTGKKPVGDVYVDRKFVRKYRVGTLVNEVFTNGEVKGIIQDNLLSGVVFKHMLKDYKGRELDDYHIADITSTLPPLSSKTWLEPERRLHEQCEHRVIYLRSPLRYESSKLADAADFNLTSEYLNNFQEPGIVVSAKVKQIFTKHRIFARFRPVDID